MVDATATDIVDDPDPGAVSVTGLKLTVMPLTLPPAGGVTVLDNETVALNPPETVDVIFEVPLEPKDTLSVVGEGVRAKPVVTVKLTVVVGARLPPVAVTVIG